MRDKWHCLPIALCVFSLGCGGKKPEPETRATGAAEKPVAVAATPADVADAPKGPFVSKFRLGSTAGPDGVVSAEAHAFVPGEAVLASFEIPNTAAGSKVRVSWAALPDKKIVFRQEAALSPDKPAVAFKADSKSWPLGDYEFLIALAEPGKDDARPMGSAPFKMVKDKPK